MRLPTSDLALIRDSKSHYTDLFLSIFQPTNALQCQVNDGSISRGERSITFDNVTSGSWENVKTGATLLVGSSVGARDVGKVRIKSITSSVITVAENSHINWQNDLFLTAQNYFDVWPVFPRIIQDPSDAEQVIFYKDYDVVYTNQNAIPGAFINIGPHRAAFDGEQLYYSASGTYPLSGAISTYEWTFEGGSPSTSSANTPGYVTYNTPGDYLTTFVVSGTTGWVETAYRYVSIYDKPSEGEDIPIQKWELSSAPAGSRGEGGWRASITVYESITVHEGSIVVLFADEYYGNTNRSLGGNAPNASKIKFVGYVMDNSIRYNYKESSVSFEVGSITQVMKEIEGFAIELQSQASPDTWFEMADVNGKKAAYHYWKWHSNIISLADIEWIGDDFLVQYFDSDRESIFDAVDNFLRTTYLGSAVADRQGKIFLEIDAYAQPNATGTFSPIFDLEKTDWIETPEIMEQRWQPLSYMEFGGIAYSGIATGTYEPLMAEAPGSAPSYRGKVDRRQGLALSGQTQLNQLVGNAFAHENTQYPSIDVPFRGNYSNLDIAPQEAIQVNIAASDTARGQVINRLYMPNNLVWTFNPEDKALLVRGTLGAITTGEAGTTIEIPEVIDDGGFGGRTGFNPPQISVPSLPVSASVYSALKLETRGGSAGAIPQTPNLTELPLTTIEFSSEGLPAGTASGTWAGQANIIPAVGASGTSSIFNYGFITALPGIYEVKFTLTMFHVPPPISGHAQVGAFISSNSVYNGLLSNWFVLDYDFGMSDVRSLTGATILKLPANGNISIRLQASNSGIAMDRGFASVQFMKYEL